MQRTISNGQSVEDQRKLIEACDRLQASIEELKVCVKYLQFDLEATRRERENFKVRLSKYEGQSL